MLARLTSPRHATDAFASRSVQRLKYMAPVQSEINHALQQLDSVRGTPLYSLVRTLRVLCQICGTAPVPAVRPWHRHLHYVWCITLLLYMYAVIYRSTVITIVAKVTIEKAFYMGESLANSLIVTFISGGCYYHVDYFHSVPCRLTQLYADLKRYHPERRASDSLYRQLYRELCCMSCFIGVFLMCCFVVDFFYFKFDVLESLGSSGAYNLPNLLISLNLGQYWLSLRFIGLLYKRLNEVLKQRLSAVGGGGKNTKRSDLNPLERKLQVIFDGQLAWYRREYNWQPASKATQTEYEILEYVRAMYSDLDTLTAQVVDAFGFVLLLNFLNSFLNMSMEFFAFYKFFDRPQKLQNGLVLFIYKLLWLILHSGRILFLLITNNALINEKCHTSFILNELPITSKDMEHAINRFLLQLMVRKHAEMACGIFDLDLLFLGGIASVLANYVIFLIQIDLGNESLTGGIIS